MAEKKEPSGSPRPSERKERVKGTPKPAASKSVSSDSSPLPVSSNPPVIEKPDESAKGSSARNNQTEKRIPRKRRERTGTISGIYYRLARQKIQSVKRKHWFVLCVLLVFGLGFIAFVAQNRGGQKKILRLVAEGLESLEKDQLELAKIRFESALERYKGYHINNPDLWWDSDSLIFNSMLRVAQGFRSLGEYPKAIDTFQSVAQHNTRGPDSWVSQMMKTEIDEFLLPEHWTPESLQSLYELLLSRSPSDWDPDSASLIDLSERVSLLLHPMAQRLQNAHFVVYGIPSFNEEKKTSFLVNGIRYYLMDRLPGEMEIVIDSGLGAQERSRLQWYLQSNRECLIFGVFEEKTPFLKTMEGIILSQEATVFQFNDLMR